MIFVSPTQYNCVAPKLEPAAFLVQFVTLSVNCQGATSDSNTGKMFEVTELIALIVCRILRRTLMLDEMFEVSKIFTSFVH